MQTARGLIRLSVELSAGVKLGHDDLERRNAGDLWMVLNRDTATIVGDGQITLVVQMHLDEVCVTGNRLVH